MRSTFSGHVDKATLIRLLLEQLHLRVGLRAEVTSASDRLRELDQAIRDLRQLPAGAAASGDASETVLTAMRLARDTMAWLERTPLRVGQITVRQPPVARVVQALPLPVAFKSRLPGGAELRERAALTRAIGRIQDQLPAPGGTAQGHTTRETNPPKSRH